jgi:hypothetical protein
MTAMAAPLELLVGLCEIVGQCDHHPQPLLLLLLLTFCTNGWIGLLACLLSWCLIDALQTNLSLLQANQRCGWSFSWSK